MTLRILLASDAFWSTSGYANQVRILVPRLMPHCDLATLATFGLHGAAIEHQGIKVYPGGNDPFANDVVKQAAQDWRADIVITLKDTFVFQPQAFEGLRWVPLCPVDHEPPPSAVLERLRYAYRPIAYAPQGFRALRAAGMDPLYCPHGFDEKIFHPEDKQAARQFLGLPNDIFIVGTVAVNRGGIPSRKAWAENLQAFAIFARSHPDAFYYVHTALADNGEEGGIPLRQIAAQLGILDRIIPCNQDIYKAGYPDEYMLALYNSMDVLNAVSLGEGFGIPQLEAQACGTPILSSDFAASRDLNFGGWAVPDERGARVRFFDNQGAYVFLPEPAAIAEKLEEAYQALSSPAERERRRGLCLAGAAPYQIDRVVKEHWLPALAELEDSIRNTASRGVLRIVRREEVFA
jgi:glycosyltransferase involved in cell wall biosynthesis